MTPIYEWPYEWYRFTATKFPLRSRSQLSPRPWAGGNSVYGPHAQFWNPSFSGVVTKPREWQQVSAFISRLGGQSGLIRIGHSIRLHPQFNREARRDPERFSDGTNFSDGTGFLSGLIPPAAFLLESARRGATTVKLGGFQSLTPRALRRGDLVEFKPNGIADHVPRLHEIMVDSATNAAGQTGIEFRPPLRAGLAGGDVASFDCPTSVFHLLDDSQGDVEMSAPSQGTFGLTLIEAIENT